MVQRKFDARHEFIMSSQFYIDASAANTNSTMIPIIMNDDAQGDPMSFKAHPEHASWAEVAQPTCFPDSEIKNMKITIDIIVPKNTSAITSQLNFQYGLISCAFPEDLDALDEKSGLTLKEVLEIQKETTDRQCYPLYNGTDLANPSSLPANIPGLTTNQLVEGISWDPEVLKDQRRYGRIKGLIKKCMPIGMRSVTLRGRSVAGYAKRITINFTPSNAKFINPYTFLGVVLYMPSNGAINAWDKDIHQPVSDADLTSNTEYVIFAVHAQYDERNPEFHMGKV